jgi:hypothetical protein
LIITTMYYEDGWVRELCIQILGKSENELSREGLKQGLKELRSTKAFVKARYFIPFGVWLKLFILSRMTFNNLINSFNYFWQILLTFTPFLFFTFINKGSDILRIDPNLIMGRLMASIFALKFLHKLVNLARKSYKKNRRVRFKEVIADLGFFALGEILFVGCLWVVPVEFGLICYLLLALVLTGFILYFSFLLIINIYKIRELGNILTTRTTFFMLFVVSFIGIKASQEFFPQMRVIPKPTYSSSGAKKSNEKPIYYNHKASAVEKVLITTLTFGYKSNVVKIVFRAGEVIGWLTLCAFLITRLFYLKLRMANKGWGRNHAKNKIEYIYGVIESNILWSKVKIYALTVLRDVDLPESYITRLESYQSDDYEFKREHERTIYELRNRLNYR